MLRILSIAGVVICLAAAAFASPITPTPGEAAAREALGNRLPNAKLLWVSGGKIYFSPVKDFSPQLVTQGAIPEGNPRWSPDGTKILYVKDPKGVWIMNADFSNRVEVIPDGDTASWTRDWQSITAVNANDRHQIVKYDLSGGSLTTLYDSRDNDYSGEFGAGCEHSQGAELHVGGRFILTFTLDNNHNTFIVDLQGKQHIYNSDMDRGDCSPSWAPDGTYTTTTARTGNRPVLKTDFDASGPTLASSSDHFVGIGDVCSCAYYVHGHRVSNDGQWVAMGGLNRDEGNREIYIWKISEPESAVVRMTFETAEDQSPSLFVGQPADCQDSDGDGYGQGADCAGPDCNDSERDVHPGAAEQCNNRDDDCDGTVDNGCTCNDGDSRPCYGGPNGTEGVGECQAGTQNCTGGSWGSCEGQVLPETENCTDSKDNDCDALTDSADSEDCPSTEEDGGTVGDDAGPGEDAGTPSDCEDGCETPDAGGDLVVKGTCGCGDNAPHGIFLAILIAIPFIRWRRKARHVR